MTQNTTPTPYTCPSCGGTEFYGIAKENYSTNSETGKPEFSDIELAEDIKCKKCDYLLKDFFEKLNWRTYPDIEKILSKTR